MNIVFLELNDQCERGAERLFHLPAFSILMKGIQSGVRNHGHNLVMAQYKGRGPLPAELAAERCSGVLIQGSLPHMPLKLRRALHAVPSVWVMRQNSDSANEFDHVFYDNQAVGALAARYLLDRQHRHVAFINPDHAHQAFAKRRETFLESVQWAGARATVWDLNGKEMERRAGHLLQKTVQELAAMKKRPSALFVPSDNDMLGVYHALEQAGIRPMIDLDLVGCNNDEVFLEQMVPRPATIDIKLELVGVRAMDQLLARMRMPQEPSRTQVFISPVLIPSGLPR